MTMLLFEMDRIPTSPRLPVAIVLCRLGLAAGLLWSEPTNEWEYDQVAVRITADCSSSHVLAQSSFI